jgi:hypothetical protein
MLYEKSYSVINSTQIELEEKAEYEVLVGSKRHVLFKARGFSSLLRIARFEKRELLCKARAREIARAFEQCWGCWGSGSGFFSEVGSGSGQNGPDPPTLLLRNPRAFGKIDQH